MSTEDYRVVMTPEEFSQISRNGTDAAFDYFDRFYVKNEKVNQLSRENICSKLSVGLKILVLINYFDGEVCNGGITQFFWNCPDLIFDVCESIEMLGQDKLQADYETACEALIGNKDNWIKLRKEAYRDEANPDWGPFAATYELLELSWFDNKYWETWSQSEPGVVIDGGMRTPLLRALADYVISHPGEYIVGDKSN